MGGNNPSIGFQSTASTWWYMLHHSSSAINFYRRSTSGSWNHDGIWDSSGNFIWQGSSVRAPIFYDQNNTALYCDPNGTSNFTGLTVANTITGSVSGNAGTATTLATARTLTIGSTGKTFNGGADVSWSTTEIVGYTPAYGTAAYQSKSLDTITTPGLYQYDGAFGGTKPPDNSPNYRTIEIGSSARFSQIAMPWNSDGYYFRRYDGTSFSTWRTVLHDGNYNSYAPTLIGTGASGSWGISVTGSSASCTGNAATVTNGMYLSGDQNISGAKYFTSNKGATSTVGANNTYSLEAFSSDAGAAGMSFHRGGYYAVNMGLDPDNVLRIGGWSASANRLQLDMSGNLTLAGVVDATQFRDSNNTAYYIDAASTSNLAGLTVANTITGSISGSSGSCTGNAANVTGTVAVANGGTGATSAGAAATNLGLGTGNTPKFLNVYGERVAVTSASSTTVNTQYNVTELTMSASITTLTLSNIQASTIVHMWTIVTVGNGTTYSITWPAAIKWPGGTAPTITATNTKRDIYQFVTYDGGTNIYAIIVGQNL